MSLGKTLSILCTIYGVKSLKVTMTTILVYLGFQESRTEQTSLAEFHQTLL